MAGVCMCQTVATRFSPAKVPRLTVLRLHVAVSARFPLINHVSIVNLTQGVALLGLAAHTSGARPTRPEVRSIWVSITPLCSS